MKVGDRQQQNRTGDGRAGTEPKEICPACKTEYLENFYGNKKRKWVKKGKYCPNELCTFRRKDNRIETTENEKEITVTYSFVDIKAKFVLDVPDTKDILQEAQTFKAKAETLVQIKSIGAGKEDLQALGEEAGFGILALDGTVTEAPMSPDNGGGAQAINAILKSCLADVLKEEGLISKVSPTDPSGFKEKKVVKKLTEAYQVAQETMNELFDHGH